MHIYTCTQGHTYYCYTAIESLQDQLDAVTKERDDALAKLEGEH